MRYLFLLNPVAGKRNRTKQVEEELRQTAKELGIPSSELQIVVTQYAGHAEKLAAAAAHSGEAVRIYTAGGDGTLNEAFRGAYGCPNAAVGCLPYGSGNDFLRSFGEKKEFLNLKEQFSGGEIPIDIIETSHGLTAMICSLGLDAQIAYGIPAFRRVPFCGGSVAYLLSTARQVFGHLGRVLEYEIDGEILRVNTLLCTVCNGRAYGGGFLAAPEADLDDGWMDIFIVKTMNRLSIAKLLALYKAGKHFKDGKLSREVQPHMIYRRAKRISVRSVDGKGDFIVQTDGECGPERELTARMHPLAVKVILPETVYGRFVRGKKTALSR